MKRLSFALTCDVLKGKLKFPEISTDKRNTTFAEVGHHHWQFCREQPGLWELWWENNSGEFTNVIPDVWVKRGQGWQIVY